MAEKTLGRIAREACVNFNSDAVWQAVADAVIQAHEARQWKAISTAPRTRQYILAYSPERKMSFQVCWDHEWGYWQMIGGGKCTMEFTHWSPLPASPQEVECEA